MKRLLLLIAVLLSYSLVNVQGFSPLNPERIEVAFITSALDNQYTFSGPSDVMDHSAIKVNGPRSLRHMFPSFQKFSFSRLSLNEEAGLQGNMQTINLCLLYRMPHYKA